MIPNAHAILFHMFSSYHPVKLALTSSNFNKVNAIFRKSISLGGYPLVELGNTLNTKPEELAECQKLNNLTSKFNLKNSNGKFETILHQIAVDPACDKELLNEVTNEHSLIRECLNSRNVYGLTPVMIACQQSNFNFLDALKGNKFLFVRVDQMFSEILNR